MSDEEWVKVATGDDAMVAELLLMFKQVKPTVGAAAASMPSQPAMISKQPLSVEWKVRQRRSKAVTVQSKKQAPRASPTTPLSWSGATSVSGGGGGGGGGVGGGGGGGGFDGSPEEESSRPSLTPHPPKRSDTSRSKVIGTGETTSTKRTRRKKTLAELKEEEDLLQKERRLLKKELTTLRLHLEKARANNEKLKRMKVELEAPAEAESGSKVATELVISDQLQQTMASDDDDSAAILLTVAAESLECSLTNGCSAVEEKLGASKFVLPDLNLPFEETSNPDILCGVS